MREDDARQRPLGIFEDRILTVPNLISLGRLACVPVFLWLLFLVLILVLTRRSTIRPLLLRLYHPHQHLTQLTVLH